jgi:hypothetical protein
MVFVNVSTSWLKKTGSPEDIFKWANSYIYKFYNVVCVVDIPNSGQAVYRWDSQAANYKPKSPFWVAVFRRKP